MKPNLLIYLILATLFIGVLSACSDIIEPDITNRPVQLEAPGNNYKSTVYATGFWWDEVEDALTYRLQVVTPKFDSIGGLVLDTVIKKPQFTITLPPGNYQWHVRAQNGSYKTAYSAARSFTILQSSIKAQKVQLTSPATNSLTNQNTVIFNWGDLYGANKYRLEIDTNNFINETAMVYNQVTPGLQLNFTFPKDQIYQWRVRAENDTAQAQWSLINTITYDHTPPTKVTLLAPDNNQSISLPVSLQWSSSPTAVKYKLYVLKSDGVSPYNTTFPLTTTATNYSFNLGSFGEKIFWKVTALDAAGNESTASDLRSFTLQ